MVLCILLTLSWVATGIDLVYSDIFPSLGSNFSMVVSGADNSTGKSYVEIVPNYFVQSQFFTLATPVSYQQNGDMAATTITNYLNTGYVIGIGFQDYQMESSLITCSNFCDIFFQTNQSLPLSKSQRKTNSPNQPSERKFTQIMSNSFQIFYITITNQTAQNVSVNITFKFKPIETIKIPELSRCQYSFCYDTLKIIPPANTTYVYKSIDSTKSTTYIQDTLGPLPYYNTSIMYIFGNQAIQAQSVQIVAGDQYIYYQVWQNVSLIVYNLPIQLASSQSVSISINQSLNNGWFAILIYTTSVTTSYSIQVVAVPILRWFLNPLIDLCHGAIFREQVDCLLKCQLLDNYNNYHTDAFDQYGYFCFYSGAPNTLSINVINPSNTVTFKYTIQPPNTGDYQTFSEQQTPSDLSGQPGQSTFFNILPLSYLILKPYITSQPQDRPLIYVPALSAFDQAFLKVICRSMKIKAGALSQLYLYTSNGDYCNYAAFYNSGGYQLAVASYDTKTETQYFYGYLFAQNDNFTSFYFGYVQAGITQYLKCPTGSILFFWSASQMIIGFYDSSVTPVINYVGVPQYPSISCQFQSASLDPYQNVFNNSQWLNFVQPAPPIQPSTPPSPSKPSGNGTGTTGNGTAGNGTGPTTSPKPPKQTCLNLAPLVTWPYCRSSTYCYSDNCNAKGNSRFCGKYFIRLGLSESAIRLKKNRIVFFTFQQCLLKKLGGTKFKIMISQTRPYNPITISDNLGKQINNMFTILRGKSFTYNPASSSAILPTKYSLVSTKDRIVYISIYPY